MNEEELDQLDELEQQDGPKQKKKILFVDDEQKVLDSVRRMLRSVEEDWDLSFMVGGKAALELMEKESFDVIVTDMRMPEMNGVELLTEVKNRHPNTIRFILSGYAEKDMVMKTVGLTEQFISKPCSFTELTAVISKALKSQEILGSDQLREMVSKMESIPSLPMLYSTLVETINKKTSSINDIADVISRDVSVSARLLQLVNSAFFGIRTKVTTVKGAVSFLGIETIKALIISTEVFSKFTEEELRIFHIQDLYKHCFLVGLISKKIVEIVLKDKRLAEMAFTAGVLHDVGVLVLIKNIPEKYKQVYKAKKERKKPLEIIEREMLDKTTHAELGGYLMSIWGLPNIIVKAISRHHDVDKAFFARFDVSSAVFVANILAKDYDDPAKKHSALEPYHEQLKELKVMNFIGQWIKAADEIKKIRRKESDEEEKGL